MSIQQKKFKAIADKIRSYTLEDGLIKPNDFVDKIGKCHDIGFENGWSGGFLKATEEQQIVIDGYLADFDEIKDTVNLAGNTFVEDDTPTSEYAEKINDRIEFENSIGVGIGIEQGKQAAYDEFWDKFQSNGSRHDYGYGLSGVGWNDMTFNPKWLISPTFAIYMFRYAQMTNLNIDKLKITNSCYNMQGLCRECSKLERFGDINATGISAFSEIFHSCPKLKQVGVVTLKASITYNHPFYNCTSLTDITFAGTIGQSLDMQYSPLNKASIESVIGCLSTTATGKTLTLKKSAVNNAFGIDVNDATTYPEGSEYYVLRHSRDNWNISYV